MSFSHKHLGFTGTKKGMTDPQMTELKKILEDLRWKGYLWMHNGDCIGSDAIAGRIWKKDLGGKIYLHAPISERYRSFLDADVICEARDYLRRDKDIAESSSVLIATPQGYNEERRSGTWTTVRYARNLRVKVIIIQPDGNVIS